MPGLDRREEIHRESVHRDEASHVSSRDLEALFLSRLTVRLEVDQDEVMIVAGLKDGQFVLRQSLARHLTRLFSVASQADSGERGRIGAALSRAGAAISQICAALRGH